VTVFPLDLQTIIMALMQSVAGEEDEKEVHPLKPVNTVCTSQN